MYTATYTYAYTHRYVKIDLSLFRLKSIYHFSANQDKRPKIWILFDLKRKNPRTFALTRRKVAKSKNASFWRIRTNVPRSVFILS